MVQFTVPSFERLFKIMLNSRHESKPCQAYNHFHFQYITSV